MILEHNFQTGVYGNIFLMKIILKSYVYQQNHRKGGFVDCMSCCKINKDYAW